MKRKESLSPVVDDKAVILILGSMPGEESLRRQEYYGYSANHFWRLISAIFNEELSDMYGAKISMIQRNGIALWDVIESCTREGSLDTMIRDEYPNALPGFLCEHSGIRAVFFNGQKAAQSFKRSFGFDVLEKKEIYWSILPSSSPANTIGFEKKLIKWKEQIEKGLNNPDA